MHEPTADTMRHAVDRAIAAGDAMAAYVYARIVARTALNVIGRTAAETISYRTTLADARWRIDASRAAVNVAHLTRPTPADRATA